jgi:mannosylglucosylglycerate synthase
MKICIAHFRVGLTDGVSLQIDERARILRQFGHEVTLIADTASVGADLNISYLDYKQNLKIRRIQDAAFGTGNKLDLKKEINEVADKIEKQIEDFFAYRHFSLIFIHNIFSLAVCLPATVAFYNFLKKHPEVRAIAVHHDFYWDPPREGKYHSNDPYVIKILNDCFPPKLPNLSHSVISIWEQKMLMKKMGIESTVITDTYDFDQEPWAKNESNRDFIKDIGLKGNEIVLLLASRIRPRKGIELGILFTSFLSKLTDKKVVLVLPNEYKDDEEKYVDLLKNKARELNVNVFWTQGLVGSDEEKKLGMKKYSLWDTYVYADVVLYPSLWEGFGNQFLEAVFAKKPVVTFEYPIFETDIRPAGFKSINMGKVSGSDKDGLVEINSEEVKKAAGLLMDLLGNEHEYKKTVESNFRIAKRKFNARVQLRRYLTVNSERYIKTNGVRSIVSPLILSGKLIASGVLVQKAYDFSESIISEIPEGTITNNEFFAIVANHLDGEIRKRFVTFELMRDFFTSGRCNGPLFIFFGGLAGKTTLSNFIVQHLNINQSISLDNEKFRITEIEGSKPYLKKATYESSDGYVKTIEALYPYIQEKVERCLFDYSKYKKWCYFMEGIYLSPDILKKLKEKNGDMYYLSVFNLPKFEDVKKQYLLRWQNELGISKLKERRNIIDGYLKNVSAIRAHLSKNVDAVASFVIESSILEERLTIFYAILYQKLLTIADREIPGWIDKVSQKPSLIKKYKEFLNS